MSPDDAQEAAPDPSSGASASPKQRQLATWLGEAQHPGCLRLGPDDRYSELSVDSRSADLRMERSPHHAWDGVERRSVEGVSTTGIVNHDLLVVIAASIWSIVITSIIAFIVIYF